MKDTIIIQTIRRNQCIINILKPFKFLSLLIPVHIVSGFFFTILGQSIGIPMFISSVAILICVIIMGIIQTKLEKNLKQFIGENIIKSIIAEKIEIQSYLPNHIISHELIEAAKITPSYDRITGSDYIKGTYKGQTIQYCDLKLEKEQESTDDDGNTSTHYCTVFQGPFLLLHLGRELNGYVKIYERQRKGRKAGIVSKLISAINKNETTVELESEAFNNQFEVRTNNEELAFYILTPQFMENIVKADEFANGYTNISFINGAANIASNNGRDAFEIRKTMFGQKQLDETRANMRRELNTLLCLVDEILKKDRLFRS